MFSAANLKRHRNSGIHTISYLLFTLSLQTIRVILIFNRTSASEETIPPEFEMSGLFSKKKFFFLDFWLMFQLFYYCQNLSLFPGLDYSRGNTLYA